MSIIRDIELMALRRARERPIAPAWAHLFNLRMAEKLTAGVCVDVHSIGHPVLDGVFELREYRDGVDYCDARKEQWIWSIGRERITGKIFAAIDTRYYEHPRFECLWLR